MSVNPSTLSRKNIKIISIKLRINYYFSENSHWIWNSGIVQVKHENITVIMDINKAETAKIRWFNHTPYVLFIVYFGLDIVSRNRGNIKTY